jgi:hypothetical protein
MAMARQAAPTPSFDTLSITPVAGTAISGRVFASEPGQGAGGATVDVPLAGVTVTVDGAEETLRTTTDAQGNFTLNPSPAGSFFVHVDGRTSPQSSYPNGNYYPSVGKRWEALAGRTDNLSGNSEDTSRGTIYLPKILANALETVSQSQDTKVDFPPAILADNPELAGTELEVPANSLFADDGTRGGRVGIAPVAPDRLPSPLPPGLNLPIVITIQTDGATNFDRPVPITFPNLPDPVTGEKLPPGAKSALWSFNHDLGDWEIIGPMTVTEDGNFVKTDAGVGVRQPGWHGTRPGTEEEGPDEPPDKKCPKPDINPWEFALDTADTVGNCIAEFVKVGKVVKRILSLVSKVREYKDTIQDIVADLQNGRANCLVARGMLIKAEEEMGELEESLLEGSEFVNPLAKIMTALGCVEDTMDLLEPLCEGLDDQPECFGRVAAGACNLRSGLGSKAGQLKGYYEVVQSALGDIALAPVRILLQRAASRLDQKCGAGNPPPRRRSKFNTFGPLDTSDAAIMSDLIQALDGLSGLDQLPRGDRSKDLDVIARETARVGGSLGDGYIAVEGAIRNAYARIDFDQNTQRTRTSSTGRLRLILPPETFFTIQIYDPKSRRIGRQTGLTGSNGTSSKLHGTAMTFDGSVDADGDGLGAASESVIGTNPANSDTDGDGISDGAEVQQGTNPLNGFIATTGIIASVPTTAPATDIHALDNVAVTANGSNGISVFNVLSGLNPTRIADVDTPGLAVAVAGNGDYVAVADYLSGLAIVDITNPTAVRLSAQVNVGASVQSVAVSGGLALAGTTTGQIVTVDLATATVLGRVNLPGGAVIQDLTVWRDTLYALQVGKLTALDLSTLAIQGSLNLSGSMGAGQRRWRLFAGEGTLYAAHTSGFNIVDTGTNPSAPTLVQNFNTSQFGWKQIVANGSGLGIAAVSPNSTNDGPHNIDLYTLGANQRTPAFGTTFETPGLAAAVSIYNGLAYVADSSSGLQVLSYLPYDNQGQAPTISLSSNFSLNTTDKTGTAEEGKLMRLSANVTDDVQVRNVEFYVDGQSLITDGNYPFEHRFPTPAISAGSPTFKVKAKATDTGGNVAWSDEFTITLVPDATPPQVLAVSPGNNAITGALTSLYASFNEPMNPSTLGAGFILKEAGPDKAHGTADDVVRTGEISYRENTRTAFMAFASPGLQPGLYRITLQTPAADGAGNSFATPFVSSFRVYNASLDTDGDGVPDEYESLLGLNPTKSDTDNDGILDGNEDYDNDGLKNSAEFYLQTNPLIADTNGNGISDGNEDSDLDGLKDGLEAQYGTNALLVDTDGDGFDDATEIAEGSDPNVGGSQKPLTRVRSAMVSILNAAAEPAPANLATTAASATITYLNSTTEPLPSNLANSAASKAVSYLNAATEPLPASRDAQSGQVSYRNNP